MLLVEGPGSKEPECISVRSGACRNYPCGEKLAQVHTRKEDTDSVRPSTFRLYAGAEEKFDIGKEAVIATTMAYYGA